MELTGTATINAPRDTVWSFLTDASTVSECVPGLAEMEIITPNEQFQATVTIGFGSMRTTFVTDVQWMTLEEPAHAVMNAHSDDGSGSRGEVTAEMTLAAAANGSTRLDWQVDVNIGGQIASLSPRLMPGVMKMFTEMFFRCVQQHIEGAS
jgi:carbon monoxide dehydrogenase subunit G